MDRPSDPSSRRGHTSHIPTVRRRGGTRRGTTPTGGYTLNLTNQLWIRIRESSPRGHTSRISSTWMASWAPLEHQLDVSSLPSRVPRHLPGEASVRTCLPDHPCTTPGSTRHSPPDRGRARTTGRRRPYLEDAGTTRPTIEPHSLAMWGQNRCSNFLRHQDSQTCIF